MEPTTTASALAAPERGASARLPAWVVAAALAALCALALLYARAVYAPCGDAYIYLV